jgi:hypothetical protein
MLGQLGGQAGPRGFGVGSARPRGGAEALEEVVDRLCGLCTDLRKLRQSGASRIAIRTQFTRNSTVRRHDAVRYMSR